MSAGSSTAAPKTSAPALVVMPKSSTTAVPPSSLTTVLTMVELDRLVVVGDRAGTGSSPVAIVTVPASNAPPPPLVHVQAVGV